MSITSIINIDKLIAKVFGFRLPVFWTQSPNIQQLIVGNIKTINEFAIDFSQFHGTPPLS